MTQGIRIETQVAKEALEVSGEALEALVGTLEALEALEGTLGALEASVETLEAMEWEAQAPGEARGEETHIRDREDTVEAMAALIMGAVAAQGGMADTATTHLNEHPGQGSADISNLDVI